MIRRILREVKEYTAASIVTPLSMVIEVIMELSLPYLMASIIDDGIYKQDMRHILIVGGIMVGAAVIGLIGGLMGGRFGAKASAGLAKNLRETMYNHIQTFSFSNIDKFATSGLVTRLTTDVTNIQNSYQMVLRIAVRAPLSMIIALVMAFTINAKIACVYLIALIFLAIVMVIIMLNATGTFKKAFPKYDELNDAIQENVSAIRVVKAYVREDQEISKLHKAAQNIYDIFVKAEKKISINFPIMSLTAYACIIVISWVGAKMIVASGNDPALGLTTGQLTSLLTYCMSILMSMMMLTMIFVMISMSLASIERVSEVLNEKPDIVNPENPVTDVKDGSISFKNVSFSYNKEGGEPILRNIDLDIKSGQVIGIMGATGSSKSSLVNLISRLYDVTEGEVEVGGVNVKNYDLEVLRNSVSVVLQKNVLFSGSVYENLRWGNKDATDEECKEACKLACADEFITGFTDGYDTHIEQGGTNISGGQKQRLCIARALLKKPKILILDDSTSAVDTATDAKIRKAFREAIPGTTKIIIAQRISSIQDADRIIVLDDGEINAFDTHENLLENNEIYREVYESQTGGARDFDETEVS